MDQHLQPAPQPDYHQYDQIWQQEAPDLEPGSGWKDPSAAVQPAPAPPTQLPPYQPPQGLPGAVQDPCCMGSEAGNLLDVLTGFIEEELVERRCCLALLRQAPVWARQTLREQAELAGEHAKRLLSACYLITGRCYRPAGAVGPVYQESWCHALRERYHTAACSGLNYARAADSTADPCLRELLLQLSREEYHQAEVIMGLLQRSL